jgi:hypothetical protein
MCSPYRRSVFNRYRFLTLWVQICDIFDRESNGSLDALEEFGRNLSRLRPDLENIVEFGGTKAGARTRIGDIPVPVYDIR